MTFASGLALGILPILNILSLRSRDQMLRSNAKAVVARMADEAVRKTSVVNQV
jgi:hypothetical protein